MKRSILILIIVFFLAILGYCYSYGSRFIKNKEVINAYGDIIEKQEAMDKK